MADLGDEGRFCARRLNSDGTERDKIRYNENITRASKRTASEEGNMENLLSGYRFQIGKP